MKHFYTIELGQAKKHLHCGIVRLFIEAFRLAFHSEDWRVSIRTFRHDELIRPPDTNELKYPKSIIEVKSSNNIKNEHPTQKPIDLMEYLVKTYTNEGDMVLDNTMGSGTTNLACLKLNRKSIGIEKEKQYYDVAVRRLSSYCG